MNNYPMGGHVTTTTTGRVQIGDLPTVEEAFGRPESNEYSSLKKYAKNLNNAAISGDIDKGVGRELELEQLVTILSKRKKANPVLVGEAGIGKSQIVYDLAHKLSDPKYTGPLAGKVIWEVSTTSLIAGCSFVGMSEERMQALLNEAINRPEVILFWDELHTIVGAGAGSKSNNDLGNIVKPALAGKHLSVIGATTEDEYNIIKEDKALNRRFNKIDVKELTFTELVEVMHGIKSDYERFHGILYNDSIEDIITTSTVHSEINQPDAAIDLMDTIGAMKKNHPDRWSKEGMNVNSIDVKEASKLLYSLKTDE